MWNKVRAVSDIPPTPLDRLRQAIEEVKAKKATIISAQIVFKIYSKA
jgi:hypothetical protein